MIRYPLAPLLDAHGGTHRTVAAVLGVEITTVHKAVIRGLSDIQADHWAGALGYLPCEVWPEWFDNAPASTECASTDCTTQFEPGGRGQRRYCSDRCKNREKQRRYRARPNGAATNRRHRRAYYEECGGYENARRRQQRRVA